MLCDIIAHTDDDFTLNCPPTVPVGREEQVGNAKCISLLRRGWHPDRQEKVLPPDGIIFLVFLIL